MCIEGLGTEGGRRNGRIGCYCDARDGWNR